MIDDCLILILENLTCSELIHKRLVCKQWQCVIENQILAKKKSLKILHSGIRWDDSDHLRFSYIGFIQSVESNKNWLLRLFPNLKRLSYDNFPNEPFYFIIAMKYHQLAVAINKEKFQ